MRKLSRTLGFLSAFFGIFTWVRSPSGKAGGLIWLPKLWAGAWAPFLSIAGGVGAFLGLVSGDKAAFWTGLFGALAGYRHTVQITRGPDSFTPTFGKDWEQKIQPDLWMRSQRRYQLLQPARRLQYGQKNVSLGNRAAGGKPLLCDIWMPSDPSMRSGLAVIYLHGSLWQALDKDFLIGSLFGRLVHQGHVILDLAYSLAPEANLKDMVGEVKYAIGSMKSHAAEYGINPERVVLMGHSGGAHLALLAAYTPGHKALQGKNLKMDSSVRAVVSICGITDLASFFDEYAVSNPGQPVTGDQIADDLRPRLHDQTMIDKLITRWRLFTPYRFGNMPGGPLLLHYLLGGSLKEVPKEYRLYSPITHVSPQCPPTLQIFGDNDFIISAAHGRRLHQALQAAGVPSV
jgi:acetyl esterase/lipase